MKLKLKRALVIMVIGMLIYFIFGSIIQIIGDAFHVTWHIIPDHRGIGNYSMYWIIMIAIFFIAPISYTYELFTMKRGMWQTKREYILFKILTAMLIVICSGLWYSSIIQYQTRFLM